MANEKVKPEGDEPEERLPGSFQVLLVDDDEEVREVLCEVIRQEGYRVTGVRGGEEALEALEKSIVDLVMTDLMMPGMTGWQLLREVKERYSDMPVVVFTGYVPEHGESMLLDRQTDGYLVKPIEASRLRTLLRAVLYPQNLGRSAEVMAVDDDRSTLKVIEQALSRRGLYVTSFTDGYEAIQHLKRNPPDLAVIDLKLYGMSGFDLCQTIRSNPETARMPILVLTATPSRENVARALELQVNGFVAKPFNAKELGERAVKALRQVGQKPGK